MKPEARESGPAGNTMAESLDVQKIRHALENLYFNVELGNSPLAKHFPDIRETPDILQRAQALRDLLLDAIEGLRPLKPVPSHAPAARSYEVLYLRYVSGFTVEEIADRLAVGERQIYRDLRRAEEELAEILRSQLTTLSQEKRQREKQNALQAELAEMDAPSQMIDLASLLQDALNTVRPLATQREVQIDYMGPPQGVTVMAPPGILKQILVQVLSAAIQSTKHQTIQVKLAQGRGQSEVSVMLPCQAPLPSTKLLQAAINMAQSIGMTGQVTPLAREASEITLSMPGLQPQTVLVVEDNPGACELYKRYLQGSEWQVVAVSDPHEVEQMARSLHPAAIILDLLMPDIDGWSILQALQLNPEIKGIPVIVCSVVNDPELAMALGAAASLKKPVSRLELLGTLKRVTRPHNAA